MMDECTNSMAPNAEELLRLVLDKEPLRQETREHLEQCFTCQQQLAVYMRTPDQLLSKLYRSACPSVTQLNLYCAGMLNDDESPTITYHIAECPLCTREVITIRQFRADFEPFPIIEAKTVFPRRMVERIIAAFVPWKPQLVTRGAAPDGPWPRQYRAGELNISLHLSRGSGGEIILLGLFTSDDPGAAIEEQEGMPVDLYHALDSPIVQDVNAQSPNSMPLMTAQIDDLGNVVFKSVPFGEYVMVVHLPEREVVIEGLSIQSL
jgi:hypothetical protein